MTADPFRRALTGRPAHRAVTLDRDYSTDPADLWAALTDPERLARWLGTLAQTPHAVGDAFALRLSDGDGDGDGDGDVASGEVLLCEPARRLGCSWSYGDEPTGRVDLVLEPLASGTRLLLTHAELDEQSAIDYGDGWERLLDSLAGSDVPQRAKGPAWAALTEHPLELRRTLAAPADRVWRAWTTAAGLRSWWWNHWDDVGFEIDLRVGGAYVMTAPHAGITVRGTYLDVTEPHHLSFTWQWIDDHGVSSDEACDLTLEPDGDGTSLTLRHTGAWVTPSGTDDYRTGWNATLDSLERMVS